MEQPAPAYEGDEPFVFVSYSHDDEALVYRDIRWLQDQGINVWFDARIQAGSEWSDAVANAISGCSRFLYFITPNSVASEHCRRELNHAISESRAILAVHLQKTDVPGGIRLNLDNRQAISRYRFSKDDFRLTLLEALNADPQRTPAASADKRPAITWQAWPLAASGLVLVVGVLGLFVLLGGDSSTRTAGQASPNMSPLPDGGSSPSDGGSGAEIGGTHNSQARAHYLLGQQLYNSDPERALKELNQAVEMEPEFAKAWVLIAASYGSVSRDPAQTETALAKMSTAAARAVSTEPDLWEAHDILGWYLMARRDFVSADRAFRKGVELAEAADTHPHPGYTQYLLQIGRHEERITRIQSVQHLEPDFPMMLAQSLYYLGRREEAAAEIERGVGDEGWRRSFERDFAIESGEIEKVERHLFVGTELEGLWGTDEFLEVLRLGLTTDRGFPRGSFANFAIFAARHGDTELALDFLRKEYLRDAYAAYAYIWHPVLADVRATNGFKSFLVDFGLVEMFQETGTWNDYCQPVGAEDFECQ